MLPKPQNYAIYPAVIPADTPTQMKVIPTEKAFLLFDGEEYTLTVISVNGDDNYYAPHSHKTITAEAHDGILCFTYTFEGEQEHILVLSYGEKKLQELRVYSLYEDLYRLRPLKGDFHSHSYRSDGKQDPAALAGHYREQGYDFFALTDHNRFYPGGEIDETYENVKLNFTRVRGEEVHAPGSVVHIVHVGGTKSVTELYVHDKEGYERDIEKYLKQVPEAVPEKYKERYAKAMWATDKIHEAGGLAIFPHPYWIPGKSQVYNVCDEFARILLMSGMFDAYELVGGMKQVGNNRSIALWGELRSEGLQIPVVGSSDVHGLLKSESFPHLFTICFAENNTQDSIISAIKTRQSVAVEASGYEYDREYRCYGSLRLVSYAQFLLQNYFPNLTRLCQGEGVAMRSYSMAWEPKELVELQCQQTNAYVQSFFGKRPPNLPNADILEFEEKWRKTQQNGPQTKGSSIETPPVTIQI